jgi:hypothetical protein
VPALVTVTPTPTGDVGGDTVPTHKRIERQATQWPETDAQRSAPGSRAGSSWWPRIAVLALLVKIAIIRVLRDGLTGTEGAPTVSPAADPAAPPNQ